MTYSLNEEFDELCDLVEKYGFSGEGKEDFLAVLFHCLNEQLKGELEKCQKI